jgi:hypothetical protein
MTTGTLDARPAALPPTRGATRIGLAGRAARVGVAVLAFVGTTAVLRAVAAPGGGPVIGGKLEYWEQHAGEYDTVFLGSSHVFRGFVPEVYDGVLEEAGFPSSSFNFGVQSVNLVEARFLVQRILEHGQGHLRRMLFEYGWLVPQIDPRNAFAARTTYWHDWDATRVAMDRALAWEQRLGGDFVYVEDGTTNHSLFTVGDRLFSPGRRVAKEHFQHWLFDRLFAGRGKDALKGLLGRQHGETGRYGLADGYLSLEQEEQRLGNDRNAYRARRERFQASQEAFAEDVRALENDAVHFGDGDWIDGELLRVDDLELVRALAQEVQARGVQFVLVVMPSQSCNRPFEERLLNELGVPVLRYNLPGRYPDLYAVEQRFDSGHLTASGAGILSRLLARDVMAASLCPPEHEEPQQ